MNNKISLIYEPLNIEIDIFRKKRVKRISMRFVAPNEVSLTCPIGISDNFIKDFISKNDQWMRDKKNRMESNVYVGIGSKIPFKGKFLLITSDKSLSEDCKIDGEKILVDADRGKVGLQVKDFLIEETREVVTPLVDKFSVILGENYKKINLKDTRSRWGSCSVGGSLMLSWRLIMAPEDVLEYVVAHEVAHLKHMNHGIKFWETVKTLCRDYKPLRKWIRSEGITLFKYKFGAE